MACSAESPKFGEIRQWVDEVLSFSSQYNSGSWSANCLVGPPRVYPRYGDLHGAWASRDINANQFVELKYAEPVYIEQINIYETYHAGAVKRVKVRTPNETWMTIYETPTVKKITHSRIFTPEIERPDFLVDELRIDVDCTGCGTWAELDAIELVGSKFVHGSQYSIVSLEEDLNTLVQSNLFSDVTFKVGGHKFAGHKAILCVRSAFFKSMFCDFMKDHSSVSDFIEFRDISAPAFEVLLHFIYANSLLRLREMDHFLLMEIWRVADRFNVEGLKSLASYEIGKMINASNAVQIYLEASAYLPVIEDAKTMSEAFIKAHRDVIANKQDLPYDLKKELLTDNTDKSKSISGFVNFLKKKIDKFS